MTAERDELEVLAAESNAARERLKARYPELWAQAHRRGRKREGAIAAAERLFAQPLPKPRDRKAPRGPRMMTVVREAVLTLLAVEPLTDHDIVDAYVEAANEHGWPPAAAGTIRQARARLTAAGDVTEVGTAPGLRGRQRTLWGLAR